jgi:hypothetical protein
VDVFSWNGAYIAPNDWYSRVHLLAGDISLRPAYKMRFLLAGPRRPSGRACPCYLIPINGLPPYRISRPLLSLENFPQNWPNLGAFLLASARFVDLPAGRGAGA